MPINLFSLTVNIFEKGLKRNTVPKGKIKRLCKACQRFEVYPGPQGPVQPSSGILLYVYFPQTMPSLILYSKREIDFRF